MRDLSTGVPARRLDFGPDAHLLASSSNGEFIALSLGTHGAHGFYVYDVARAWVARPPSGGLSSCPSFAAH